MMFESNSYPQPVYATGGPVDTRPPSVRERLMDEKARCEGRLFEINNALALLDENPGVATVLEALSKIGF
jgi:hypothetical protein